MLKATSIKTYGMFCTVFAFVYPFSTLDKLVWVFLGARATIERILLSSGVNFQIKCIFCGYTVNTIFASIISLSIIFLGKLYRLHFGFIFHDILNAFSAISTVTLANPSRLLILLDTSNTKYFAYFSFCSVRQASKV